MAYWKPLAAEDSWANGQAVHFAGAGTAGNLGGKEPSSNWGFVGTASHWARHNCSLPVRMRSRTAGSSSPAGSSKHTRNKAIAVACFLLAMSYWRPSGATLPLDTGRHRSCSCSVARGTWHHSDQMACIRQRVAARQVRPSKVLDLGMRCHLQEHCTEQRHFHIASLGSRH